MTVLEIIEKIYEEYDGIMGISYARNVVQALEEAGFRIVPVEPTEEMYEKGMETIHEYCPKDVYKAMLKASRPDADRAD